MRCGGEDGAAAGHPDLESLRARLYTPDATPEDRAAYAAALDRAIAAPVDRPVPTDDPEPTAAPERSHPVASRAPVDRVGLTVLAAALVIIGAGLGAGITSIGTTHAASTAAPSATTTNRGPDVPTPIAARSTALTASQRTEVTEKLARVLATSTDTTAIGRAIQAIGPVLSGPMADSEWMRGHACSTSSGVVRASTRGRPVVLTSADEALQVPVSSHFRLSIVMIRPASWAWTLSTGGGERAQVPIALGAGSPEAGIAQYAEFDGTGPGDLTRVEVSTGSHTPFLWELESCVTG